MPTSNLQQETPMKEKSFSEIEQETWNQRAGYYDELFAPISTEAIPFILDGLGSLDSKRHLDVACGTGHLVAAAAQRGAVSQGIDIAPSMIEAARKNYPGQTYSPADAAGLPFDDASFDAVTCAFGLSHLENPQAAVDEAFRVLAPDGRFAFTLWFGPDDGNELQAIVKEAVAAYAVTPVSLPESWTQLRWADEQRCVQLLLQAGFGRPDFKRLPIVGTFKKREDVLANIEKLSIRSKMVINSQPAAIQQRIKETILAKAEAQRRNGVIPMNWPALRVTAQKPRQAGGNHNAQTS
jgi:ubiquinone/menaquinone biosynthesis C-methylase UbiE